MTNGIRDVVKMATPSDSLARVGVRRHRDEIERLRAGGEVDASARRLIEALVATVNAWADLAESFMAADGGRVTGARADEPAV